MSNNSTIKCPNCQTEFEATDSFKAEIQVKLQKEAQEWKSRKDEEFKKKEEAFQKQLADTLNQQKVNIEQHLRKTLSQDYENQFKLLQDTNKENEDKL